MKFGRPPHSHSRPGPSVLPRASAQVVKTQSTQNTALIVKSRSALIAFVRHVPAPTERPASGGVARSPAFTLLTGRRSSSRLAKSLCAMGKLGEVGWIWGS